jgi:hypothetical protein
VCTFSNPIDEVDCTGTIDSHFIRLVSISRTRAIREVLRLYTVQCLACNGSQCVDGEFLTIRGATFDVTNGELYLFVDAYESQSGQAVRGESGLVVVSGFTRMFDTLLTFIPGQQSLNILTPANPDGFRSADSMQVWTGDVRSMSDWSQAQPLACSAATSPLPGQVVTVPDALPDPAVGRGRYYLVASQSGSDRRLGRQYVNGAFSARTPSGLPVCQ